MYNVSRSIAIVLLFFSLTIADATFVVGKALEDATDLRFPYFASIKAKRANVRTGPSIKHDIIWTFVRPGIPIEVLRVFDVWYKIRDVDGQDGWIKKGLVSRARVAIVMPWDKLGKARLWDTPQFNGKTVAVLESGVLLRITSCNAGRCLVSVGGYVGYVSQDKLWGVYPEEIVQ